MSTSRKPKLINTKNNAKIDTYFKPVPKASRSSIKRKAANDENFSTDENNNKRPFASSKSQPLSSISNKRKFGEEIKSSAMLLKKHNIQLPLRDTNPKKSLILSTKKINGPTTFAVLSDNDIKKGIERALTPTNLSKVFKDSQEELTSCQDEESSIDSQEGIADCQDEKGSVSSQDCQHEKNSVHSQDSNKETKINSQHVYKEPAMKDETKTGTDKSNKEVYSNSEDDDDDLFTQTTDTAVKFKPVKLDKTRSECFFSDNEDQDDDEASIHSNSANYNDVFVDPDLEFSVSEISSIPKQVKERETLPNHDKEKETLSLPEPESISQMIVPYPNPRGNHLLDKLDIKKASSQSCFDEEDDTKDDELPISL